MQQSPHIHHFVISFDARSFEWEWNVDAEEQFFTEGTVANVKYEDDIMWTSAYLGASYVENETALSDSVTHAVKVLNDLITKKASTRDSIILNSIEENADALADALVSHRDWFNEDEDSDIESIKVIDEALSALQHVYNRFLPESKPLMKEIHPERTLQAGSVLTNGATVVVCTKTRDAVPSDSYATYIAVCVRDGENFHDYAVWTVIDRPEGFVAEHGDYRHTLTEAIGCYENRRGVL
jgi:hypothetical protein